jgi:alkaline phosphatase D
MHRLVALVLLGLFAPALPFVHAAGALVSGPMLGYQTHREVAIWLETRDAKEIALSYRRVDTPEAGGGSGVRPVTVTLPAPAPTPAGGQPVKFILGPLEMGARYTYSVAIDGRAIKRPYPLTFRTTAQFEWREPAPDFSFLLGSCAYFNDAPYDRPGKPYGSGRDDIWGTMAASGADFMLWLGDTVYLREADFSSASGIWYRQRTDRATPAFQAFLAAMPHYATWDDHEFGPNNANGDWPLAPVARAAFEAYWPNQSFGTPRDPAAIYHRFQWSDAQFILLDNRTHRVDATIPDDSPGIEKTQYGRAQMDWLKQQLASRNEGGARRHQRLTFIVTGSQFLAQRTYPGSEDHHRYQAERAEIVEFIRANKIGGVVFLTGDVHYSEVLRRDGLVPYPLYEFTSSSLTAGAHTRPLPDDPGRLLAVQRNNYCRIAVSGPPESRSLVYTVHDEAGAELARKIVALAELEWPVEQP